MKKAVSALGGKHFFYRSHAAWGWRPRSLPGGHRQTVPWRALQTLQTLVVQLLQNIDGHVETRPP